MLEVQSIWLKEYLDSGIPTPNLFEVRKTQLLDDPPSGGVLLQILVMSVDPYLRAALKSPSNSDSDIVSEDGKLMTGFVAGKVLKSKTSQWKVGDLFGASLPFSTYAVLTKEMLESPKKVVMWKLTGIIKEEQIAKGVGIFGMPGCTAYAGTVDILQPKPGDTLFVSAASGAVGSLVPQIARACVEGSDKGSTNTKITTIGSCGGLKKCKALTEEFGYDHAIDYKELHNDKTELVKSLKQCLPQDRQAIDMYFENVGGIHFDAAIELLNTKGRIAVCGAITMYNESHSKIPKNELSVYSLIYKQAKIEGFICAEWLSGARGDMIWLQKLSKWTREGRIKSTETVVSGVEHWGDAFCSLFTGSQHLGKLVVKV